MRPAGASTPGKVAGIIPARWGSTRLPQKMLADVAGKPLIVRTYEAAKRASSLDIVLVATDDKRLKDAVEAAGGRAVLTDPELPSGSDRIWAAAKDLDADILVNLQGDEPLMPAGVIDAIVQLLLDDATFDVTTASAPLEEKDLANPDVVKVAVAEGGRALYFSRAPIPFPRGNQPPGPLFRRHIGIYVYRREALEAFCSWPPSPLEQTERLEQLRLLEHGRSIGVADVNCDSIGVDTEADLERVRELFLRREG
ncbi:3-deoxy-manno-octulosonate cytidylyltransferase [bacterium]|nr:3-deoxy-manno-octulosonate cytidylyltransferase [bacterium]